jgi:5-methylcytosine-specific restriction enzyme A
VSRNPDWTYDELILALDLYLEKGQLDDTHPDVIELSTVLNALPIHTDRPDAEKFRNPNGVAMKLGNFRAHDPSQSVAGLSRGNRREVEVWKRFANASGELRSLAQAIRAGASGAIEFPTQPEEGEDEVEEGRLLYRMHRTRERDSSIIRKKKQQALKSTGGLACEVCSFDFAAVYGELGHGYAECHHTVPLSHSGATKTRLSDLAIVCSNCHRMLHRRQPWSSIADLRQIVTASAQP